ncbi:MAG: hypothetical protein OXP69_01080 [Spirochaetaceae bacterium]|nr:hypothetical protein [Spirochaetaceae bacterium]MDE0448978.1 hypothetical protein [Spirochaetaceae bacterium]
MKSVGIKVLKDNLSKYLRMVRDGEIVLVTDRDEVIAEIQSPQRLVSASVTRWELFLRQEERRGSMRRPKGGPVPSINELRKLPRPVEKVDLQRLLDQIRSDR